MVKALEWLGGTAPVLRIIDQTRLPLEMHYRDLTTVDELVRAIEDLAVRGAPALGACGALGVALAMYQGQREGWDSARLDREIDRIRDARPTAVNLAWGVDQIRHLVPSGVADVLAGAQAVVAADTHANQEISRLGADWILAHTQRDKIRINTHCNTGALATTAQGTAYGIISELARRGRLELVYVDETRPLLQGARLTSWELTQDGIDHVIQVDGAATSTILRGLVDFAIIGADRIAANGDTANKIGSCALALACERAGIPFIVAAPTSTIDLTTATGAAIPIELRDAKEILEFAGVQSAPIEARGYNPAFDVTPHDLISAIVTERGIVEPARELDPHALARVASVN